MLFVPLGVYHGELLETGKSERVGLKDGIPAAF
jgi:hypothetical protein